MKILYFTQQEANKNHGIYKKILYQVEALKRLENTVDLIANITTQNNVLRVLKKDNSDEEIIEKNSLKFIQLMRYVHYNKVYKLIEKEKYDLIYIRYPQAAMPLFNNFLRKIKENIGSKIVLEIPTYPYDDENKNIKGLKKIKIILEKRYRKYLKNYVDKIVTFSEDKKIFEVVCINIANGIDLEEVKIKKEKEGKEEVNFVHVSVTRFWHGVDRFLDSLIQYIKNGGKEKIRFHIVGEGSETLKLKKIVEDNIELQDIVIFHGFKSGEDLDEVYNNSDIAIGSLGFFRSGLEKGSTLKMREYCAKGLPLVVGYDDTSFSRDLPFYYQVSNDESLLDIEKIIEWYKNLKVIPEEIRKYAEDNLTWDKQMKKVIDSI